jgi:hypothetical protein
MKAKVYVWAWVLIRHSARSGVTVDEIAPFRPAFQEVKP